MIYWLLLSTLLAPLHSVLAQGTGWQTIPVPDGSELHTDWKVNGVDMPVLVSTFNPDRTKVKRAIVGITGGNRNCWTVFTAFYDALKAAEQQNLGVKVEEVSIVAPCFQDAMDMQAGAVSNTSLIWSRTNWASGHYAEGPAGIVDQKKISSFDVLDNLVSYHTDLLRYPNMRTVVVAGHSLGGQMAQRYAAMRTNQLNEGKVHYWTANPGSILWLTSDRPHQELVASCPGYDDYKYGFNGTIIGYSSSEYDFLGKDGFVSRYMKRKVHYAWGTADTGLGDKRCQAKTQGGTHIERGRNFDALLHRIGFPNDTQTIDYVPGVAHNTARMIASKEGIDKIFVLNYNGTLLGV